MNPGPPTRPRVVDRAGLALDVALVGLAALALTLSLLLPPEGLPQRPLCPFRQATGLPCPGCGLTHSFCAIGQARFVEAWAFNPFGFVFYAGSLALLVWPLWRRRFPGALGRLANSSWLGGLPLGLVIAMWAFGAWRIWRLLGP